MNSKPIKFKCPKCGQHLEGTREHIGISTTCPNCGIEFVITVPSSQSGLSGPRPATSKHERNPLLVPLIIVTVLLIVTLFSGSLYIANNQSSEKTFVPSQTETAFANDSARHTAPSVQPSPLAPVTSPLELIAFDYSFEKGEYSELSYRISTQLKNTGDKGIKLADASIVFSDLLGATLYSIKLGPDISIAAGSTASDSGSYHINQFDSTQARMKEMKKEDVRATLIVRQLVFTDNSITTYTK